jgi:hypothetical protein
VLAEEEPMEHPLPVEQFSPQVAKVCGPAAPPQLKQMAAAGLAPLGPVDLVTALYVLAFEPDEQLSGQAQASLAKLPDNTLLGALDQQIPAPVLDGIADFVLRREDAVQKILLTPDLADETVVRLTEKIRSERLLEVVAANEERMLRCPEIIEKLYFNRAARMSTVDRAVELAVRNGLELDGIPSFAEVKAAIEGELILEATDEPTPDDLMFMSVLTSDDLAGLGEELVDETLESQALGEEQGSEAERRVKDAQQSIAGLTVSQKIRVALLGTASQRAVLIRDSNKLVTMSVLRSPAVRDSEVIRFSQARSLPEEALRYISSKREWTKNYQVKVHLVKNPRTPIHDALRFLQHLRPHDVRGLERSRDVPQAVAAAARNLRMKRGR